MENLNVIHIYQIVVPSKNNTLPLRVKINIFSKIDNAVERAVDAKSRFGFSVDSRAVLFSVK